VKRTAFLLDVTDEDVLDVVFDVEGGKVVAFSVNYRALVRGEWREVVRYDTSHGRLHVHEFWPAGTERILPLEPDPIDDYTSALEEAMNDLDRNWKTYRSEVEENP
jgi:hypothetical protein